MPGKGGNRIIVTLEGVHLLLHISEIPDSDRLISGSCGNEDFGLGVESQRIDGIQVASLCNNSSLVRLTVSQVYDLQSLVV